jgi:hypothetical protein
MSKSGHRERADQRAIRGRLKAWVDHMIDAKYGTRVAFERAVGLTKSTVTRMRDPTPTKPWLPSGELLLRLTKAGLSADELFTGRSPSRRVQLAPRARLAVALRADLVRHLKVLGLRVALPDTALERPQVPVREGPVDDPTLRWSRRRRAVSAVGPRAPDGPFYLPRREELLQWIGTLVEKQAGRDLKKRRRHARALKAMVRSRRPAR